jgi:hypothetical protein
MPSAACANGQVHARLAALYPEYDIAHMPADAIQGHSPGCSADTWLDRGGDCGAPGADPGARSGEPRDAEDRAEAAADTPASLAGRCAGRGAGSADGGPGAPDPGCRARSSAGGPTEGLAHARVRCAAFVGNAAAAGDAYAYHVDADPAAFPDSPWRDRFGDYANGARGRPLLASLLVYLDAAWPRDWGAETLFLDGRADVGVAVAPRPGRAVLMDQDLLHRVSAPSPAAGRRPRYSLVWKLAFLPRAAGAAACLARPAWGPPVSLGSAAHVEQVKRALKRKAAAAALGA